jgi:phenylacetate-coenzyme A ligase PaaK-like adenylate-forming protein
VEAFTPFAPLRERMQAELMRRAPDHLARLGWGREAIAARQRERLRALLAYAQEHSPFHARRLRSVVPDRFELEDLPALPVMTKAELMDEFDDALTDRRLGRALAEQALALTKTEPQPLFGEYVCQSSGGSSGKRAVYVQDFDSMAEFMASVNRYPMRQMLRAGGPPPGGITVAMVAAASAVHATGAGPAWTAGGLFRFVSVPVTLPLSEIVERLNALQPDGVFGYPSVLARLAVEQREGRLRIAPKGVTCSSENLLPEWRSAISAAFGAPLLDTFGSTEGLVGATEPDEQVFSFNSDVCIVELVDERGAPVPDGQPAARILLTNLANRTQPLIRYEIRDRFVRQPDAAEHGHLRATVDGRSDEMLHFGATAVHPLVIRSVLVKTPAVSDYQVRQAGRGIDVRVLESGPVDRERLRRELRSALSAAGLPDAEVTVHAVQALERHAETGKLRRFVSA